MCGRPGKDTDDVDVWKRATRHLRLRRLRIDHDNTTQRVSDQTYEFRERNCLENTFRYTFVFVRQHFRNQSSWAVVCLQNQSRELHRCNETETILHQFAAHEGEK